MEISECPDHPEDGTHPKVIKVSLSGTDKSIFVCLICGKRLGDAGPREEPITESFNIKRRDIRGAR